MGNFFSRIFLLKNERNPAFVFSPPSLVGQAGSFRMWNNRVEAPQIGLKWIV
jgi:hypothetical protein